MTTVWTKIGGRKLIAFVLGMGAVVGLASFGLLTDTVVTAVLGLVAIFSGGNVAEHFSDWLRVKALNGHATPKPAEPAPEDSIE